MSRKLFGGRRSLIVANFFQLEHPLASLDGRRLRRHRLVGVRWISATVAARCFSIALFTVRAVSTFGSRRKASFKQYNFFFFLYSFSYVLY